MSRATHRMLRRIGFWEFVISSVGVAAVYSGSGPVAPHAETPAQVEGHLERLEDAPSPVPPAPSIRATSRVHSRGAFQSVQVNVDAEGNNIFGDAANEPSIAVDPIDPTRIAIGWRQFDTVSSNFRQAGWGYSQDGGSNWTFPGTLEPEVFRSDPVLASDAEGTFFYYSLTGDFTCQMFRSFDGGVTWGPPIPAFGGDKAWMTVDTTDGIGRGNIYCAWSSVAACCGTRIFTRSTDGGVTYMEPIAVPGNPRWGTCAVGSDGALYIAGGAFSSGALLVRSSDAQDADGAPTFDLSINVDLGGTTRFSTGPNPGGLLGQVYVDTDRSAGAHAGNVYMLGSVDPPGSDPLDVMFARSADGGFTWSAPIRVNDDGPGANAWQWFGTMSVAPIGRIDVVWNDTRSDPTASTSVLYYTHSLDGGLTWAPNMPVSPPFDHFLGYPNQSKLGDYYHMVSDNFGANLAYAATFNGEQDVYFLRIDARDCNGNGVDDEEDITAGTSNDCNSNALPDECEADCNQNGAADECDVFAGTSLDCNEDLVPDACQLAGNDCDSNGEPDDCQSAALILADPQDTEVCPGGTAVFRVTPARAGMMFQWKRDGDLLVDGDGVSGATSDTITIDNVEPAQIGAYTCVVSEGCISAESEPGLLGIFATVEFESQPQPHLARCENEDAAFQVEVSGAGPFTYEWRKNGVALGAPSLPLLLLPSVQPADAGTYSCNVSDPCVTEESASGQLEVLPVPEFIEQPQDACAPLGGMVTLTARALADGEVNYEWQKSHVGVGEGDTLVLGPLQPEDAGIYRAVAYTQSPVCVAYSDLAMVQVGGCCQIPGDVDEDGDVDLADVQRFAICFGAVVSDAPTCKCADLNDDGTVGIDDWPLLGLLLAGS